MNNKTLIPLNNFVLCEKIIQNSYKTKTGFIYTKEEFPVYKIIKISEQIKDFKFKLNDNIIINSTGTSVRVNNKEYYLINISNIIGKVAED